MSLLRKMTYTAAAFIDFGSVYWMQFSYTYNIYSSKRLPSTGKYT